MAVGCKVLDLGVIPTPALQYFVKTHDYVSGGVMITASHNPPQFNGIKCIASDGTEMHKYGEEKIEALYRQVIPANPWNTIGSIEKVIGAADSYINAVISNVDSNEIRHAGLKVVLDCANGAACRTTPLLLQKLGVVAITLNADPQGEFPGHPSEPTEDNLQDLMTLTKFVKADLGIAHDGDADRTVFVSQKGKYISGDKSLALISKNELSEKKGGVIVTPVSSSSMVEDVVKEAGGTVIYTAVGSPIVARKMMEVKAIFGGEENGGLIFPEHQFCRDGAMTIAKMLECVVKYGPLHKQVDALPVYYVNKRKVPCPDDKKETLLAMMKALYNENKIDATDGLKIFFDDGWILARPSGTEPIFRIFSESKDENVAIERGQKFEDIASGFINA
jgi:phosphomannomutase/phosphoglucomutase